MNRLVRMGALLMLVLGREGPDSIGEGATSVRDSAGVTIVEHPIDLAEAATVVRLGNPLLSYGSGPSDYLFEFIIDGALLPDGCVVVADAGDWSVMNPSLYREVADHGPDGVWLAGFSPNHFGLGSDELDVHHIVLYRLGSWVGARAPVSRARTLPRPRRAHVQLAGCGMASHVLP